MLPSQHAALAASCPHSKLPSQHALAQSLSCSLINQKLDMPVLCWSAGGIITDLVSYYTLPSSVIGNDKYDSLKAAFMYYTVATKTALQDLMHDVLVLAGNRYGCIKP